MAIHSDIHRHTQAHRQTDRQTHTGTQTDRQTDTHTHKLAIALQMNPYTDYMNQQTEEKTVFISEKSL